MRFINKNILSFTLALSLVMLAVSCNRQITETARGYQFVEGDIQYHVEFYTPSIVRILSLPVGDTLVTKRMIVDDALQTVKTIGVRSTKQYHCFKSPQLEVRFYKEKGAFSFYDRGKKEVVLREKEYDARIFTASNAGGEECLAIQQQFISADEEGFYGLGQYQNGLMNYRNHEVILLQSNTDIVNPLLLSTEGYGLLWDNYSSTIFSSQEGEHAFRSEVGDASDYYFLLGSTMDEIVSAYRYLTGAVPMFPKWAFGFWQSKERYKSFAELESVVNEYRKRRIPLDNIVQDWEYWGDKPNWNSLRFETDGFKNPEQAIRNLHEKYRVQLMVSVWPGFGPETAIYQELSEINALFDERTWAGYKVFDVYDPQAREIFWKYLKDGLYDKGIDAWWLDATEPSFRDGFTQLKQEERTKSAGRNYLGTFHRYLNTYSLELSKFLYEKFKQEDPDKRVFILTRSAFASQQQYATAVWSGDVPASWENMHKQISAGSNLSMSGIPYWTSDIGGFQVTQRGGEFPNGLADDAFKELYTRWFQFGAFSPIFRSHGTDVPREIWQFGEPGSQYYETQLKFIQLRYRLLPYIYSLAKKVSATHYTLMRALVMDFQQDKKTHHINNAYMFGDAFLVRPVTQPMGSEKSIEVQTYLPTHNGRYWYDFWSNQVYEGGNEIIYDTPIDRMPLFVKAGSIIPMANVKQYSLECPDTELEIRIYAGADAQFTLYDDDGLTDNFNQGAFSEIVFDWNENNKTLTIGDLKGSFQPQIQALKFTIHVYDSDTHQPKSQIVDYKGEQIKVQF